MREALWSLVTSSKYNDLTITNFVHKYAPSKDNNDEGAYVNALVGAVHPFGMGADSQTGNMLETSLSAFIEAIQRHEGFEEGTVTYRPIQ